MTIPDPIGDIVQLLKADTAVTAIAGSRVFAGGIPQSQQSGMAEATVVVKPAGGPGRPKFMLIRRGRIDTVCYGATLHESWQLHLAVREALETLDRPSRSVIEAEILSDGSNAVDPVEQWPTCYASYSVLSPVTV